MIIWFWLKCRLRIYKYTHERARKYPSRQQYQVLHYTICHAPYGSQCLTFVLVKKPPQSARMSILQEGITTEAAGTVCVCAPVRRVMR